MYLNSTLKEGGVAYRLSESRNVVDGLIYDKRNECEARVELARVSIYVYICVYMYILMFRVKLASITRLSCAILYIRLFS